MSGRVLLVDASVFITLTEINELDALYGLDGTITVPELVRDEISDDPANAALERAIDHGDAVVHAAEGTKQSTFEQAAEHLGEDEREAEWPGDVALLALALGEDATVVITDDKPLRKTCKALSIPVSGSIGVLVRAVERGTLDASEAKRALVAMDEVGARLSARLFRRAERLIDDADS